MSSSQPPSPSPGYGADHERYSRQILFAGIGEEGQRRLGSSSALLVGCGALGSLIAELLVRAGVGNLLIVDRDFVEASNLQRQVLFDEEDARLAQPKAVAAAEKLGRINSAVVIEGRVADVTAANIVALARGRDLILDGSDNFEVRYLINDLAVKTGTAWIHGAAVGSCGLTMNILPGETACLRCLFENAPPPGGAPTCDTAGVLGPLIGVIASMQAMEAIKFLAGRKDKMSRDLVTVDLWEGRIDRIRVPRRVSRPDEAAAGGGAGETATGGATTGATGVATAGKGPGGAGDGGCPACDLRRFDHLEGAAGWHATVLCGRNSVQVTPASPVGSGGGGDGGPADRAPVDLEAIAGKLEAAAGGVAVVRNRFLVKARIGDSDITIFTDGRAIIGGTTDPAAARALYARFVGA